MSRKLVFYSIMFLIVTMGWWYGCKDEPSSSARHRETVPEKADQSALHFLSQQKGKVVVLLLGIEGCGGTLRATKVLAEMSQDCPDDVVLARLDVPTPGGQFKPLTNWDYDYFFAVDTDRAVANRLDFFYYPTLYILDREGEVRYAGGCDIEKLKTMLDEIRAEKLGSKKKFYTPPLPAVGTPAAGFIAKSFEGKDIDLTKFPTKGATLLFFTSVDCPFSREAAKKLPVLEKEFADNDVTIVTIEKGTTDAINALYNQITLKGPVVLDKDGVISQKYGVEPVPFYFVIDKDGKIAGRGPYTEASARQMLQVALGLKKSGTNDEQPGGAG